MKIGYCDSIKIDTKTFNIKINTYSLVSVITGTNSCENKYLFTLLSSIKSCPKGEINKTNVNLNDVILCSSSNDISYILLLYERNEIENKIVFIDRYDLYHSKELNDFIKSGKNKVIVMSNNCHGELGLHTESYLVMKHIRYSWGIEFYTKPLLNRT